MKRLILLLPLFLTACGGVHNVSDYGAPGADSTVPTKSTGDTLSATEVNDIVTAVNSKEDDLGNPAGNDYYLKSQTDGTRSWSLIDSAQISFGSLWSGTIAESTDWMPFYDYSADAFYKISLDSLRTWILSSISINLTTWDDFDFNGTNIVDDTAGDGDTNNLWTADKTYDEIAAVKFQSLAVADLSDTATPHVLTAAETTNKVISNYASTGADRVYTVPTCHTNGNVIFQIGDEYQIDVEPSSGENFYLNGTAMASDEHIQNTADTLGQRLVGYCVNINGTSTWMFYSSDSDFVEETP